MRFLVTHFGSLAEVLPATCVNRALRRACGEIETQIDWIVDDDQIAKLFIGSPNVRVFSKNNFCFGVAEEIEKYNLLINLHPSFKMSLEDVTEHLSDDAVGFNFSENDQAYYNILYSDTRCDMNIFQIYCRLCGLKWKGESYDINYYPKTRSKRNRAGIAVAHANLRRYVQENLELDSMKLWTVPFKQNVLKRIDEVNRCSRIITDDLATMHLAIYLRKEVHFLETIPLNFTQEFFGKGRVYPVPSTVTQYA